MKNFNVPEFSVSEFSRNIKRLIEDAFGFVRIRGEISGLKKHSSGHVYFSLKDEKALIAAVCFANIARNIDFELKDGLEVVISGQITTYEARSNYQIIVEKVEIAGIGALLEEIENRRKKLLSEGLFDEKHKKPLPFLPKKIAVITSPTGAVIEDIKHRIQARFPTNLIIYPSLMQGHNCAKSIISGIKFFNELTKNKKPDLIIIARGGGSFEDLLPFNDEELIREVFKSEIPIISAVGHETDTTLIDFVADLRAPTPTAAAEISTPVLANLLQNIDFLAQKLQENLAINLKRKSENLQNLMKYLISPKQYLQNLHEKFFATKEKLHFVLHSIFQSKQNNLAKNSLSTDSLKHKIAILEKDFLFLAKNLQIKPQEQIFAAQNRLKTAGKLLQNCDYKQILQRGFALIKDKKGNLITTLQNVKNKEIIEAEISDGKFSAIIVEGENKIKKSVNINDDSQYKLI